MYRIGCEACSFTGTRELPNGLYDICECVSAAKQEGLDEDNYMELYGIKNES